MKKLENYKLKQNTKILKLYKKLKKTAITFGRIKIQKKKFWQHKRTISIENVDINKILVSNKVSFGKQGFK